MAESALATKAMPESKGIKMQYAKRIAARTDMVAMEVEGREEGLGKTVTLKGNIPSKQSFTGQIYYKLSKANRHRA